MDSRAVTAAVITCLYLLNAQAAPLTQKARNDTIEQIKRNISIALGDITDAGLLPDISCQSQNLLVGLEKQNLTAHLSSSLCYMLEISKRTPELSSYLLTIGQNIQQILKLELGSQTDCKDGSQPALEPKKDDFLLVKCLLEPLGQRLNNTTF